MGGDLTIKVNTERMLQSLRENRDKHAKDYDKAKRGWKKLIIKELRDKLDTLEKGGSLELRIVNQKPEGHLDEYDEAIDMLSFAVGDTMELDQSQFRQYIKDDWSWKRHWLASNTTYIEAAN